MALVQCRARAETQTWVGRSNREPGFKQLAHLRHVDRHRRSLQIHAPFPETVRVGVRTCEPKGDILPHHKTKCRREWAWPERVWDGSPARVPLVKGARRPDAAQVRHLDDRVRRQLDQADGVRILVCNLIE